MYTYQQLEAQWELNAKVTQGVVDRANAAEQRLADTQAENARLRALLDSLQL